MRDGYETAFDEIVRRYGGPLRRYAATIVAGRSEDVTQGAFSKALLALRRDGAEIELRPWLFRIVRNTALNDLRDSPPSAEVLAEALAGGRNPAEELERREELAELIRQLRTLPEPQRAAIVMRELEGLGHEEIAAALGLSGGAARQAIYRARKALRDGLGMLLPMPLLKALLAGSSSAPAEAAAAAGAGAGGAGVVLKATTATVLVAGALEAGAAIDHGHRHESPATADTGRVGRSDSSQAAATDPGLVPGGDGTSGQSEQGAGSGNPNRRRGDAGEQRGSIEQGGGRDGRGESPTPSSGPGDGTREGQGAAGSGKEGAGDGGSPGKDGGQGSGDSVSGSPGPGGGSEADGGGGGGGDGSSGPGDGSTAPAGAGEGELASGDSSGSNSGPGSGDDGGGTIVGSDDPA